MFRTPTIIFLLALCIQCIVCKSCCGRNEVYSDCVGICPLTCKNYQNPPKLCALVCKKGCKCVNGTILNNEGKCVLPSEC